MRGEGVRDYNAGMHRLVVTLGLFAVSAAGAEMTGWISDSTCGRSNGNGEASARECAERCLKEGAKPILVTDGDQKVYKLAGKPDVMTHLKHKVKVTGRVEGDTVTVESITKAD